MLRSTFLSCTMHAEHAEVTFPLVLHECRPQGGAVCAAGRRGHRRQRGGARPVRRLQRPLCRPSSATQYAIHDTQCAHAGWRVLGGRAWRVAAAAPWGMPWPLPPKWRSWWGDRPLLEVIRCTWVPCTMFHSASHFRCLPNRIRTSPTRLTSSGTLQSAPIGAEVGCSDPVAEGGVHRFPLYSAGAAD